MSPPRTLPYTTLDVFTTEPYIGNPLALVRVPPSLSSTLTESQKQKIAREFNYSETVFLHEPSPNSEEKDELLFDIFTPLARISFAGHPTIGTAIYIGTHASSYPGISKIRTIAGSIPLSFSSPSPSTGADLKATVRIPHDVHTHASTLPHPLESSGHAPVPIVSIVKGMAFGLALMPTLSSLASISGPLLPSATRFDGAYLDAGSGWDVGYTGSFYYHDLGFRSEEGVEGEVRVLRTRSYPAHEDPGTGSASGALCCYLVQEEKREGTTRFHLIQGVEMGRRCDIWVEVDASGGVIEEVRLSGQAVEVMEGMVRVPSE